MTIADARGVVGEDRVVQGNLSNRLLCDGTKDEIEAAARAVVESGGCRGGIFNFDHGLLRETPYENIQHLIRVIRPA